MSEETNKVLAWEVELNDMRCFVFAITKAKAQWKAVQAYWEAYGRRKGEWPRAVAFRAQRYDNHSLRLEKRQQAWTEDYLLSW